VSSFHILVLCRHALGDIVLARPVFRNLRAWRPDAKIIAGAYPDQVPFLSLHPEIDETVVVPRKAAADHGGGGHWLQLVRRLRANRPDLLYDMLQTQRSSLLTAASGAKQRVGFAQRERKLRHRAYTDVCVWTDPDYATLHSRDLYLKPLEQIRIPITDRGISIELDPNVLAEGSAILRSAIPSPEGPVVAVHPGASEPNKLWPAADFAAVCDRIQEAAKSHVLLLGARSDQQRIREIASLMRSTPARLPDTLNIRQLAAFFAQTDLFFGHDSGPMHLATAVGTPVAALFGASPISQWGPIGEGHTVLQPTMPCRCQHPQLCRPGNPYHMYCVRRLTRAEVGDALCGQLARLTATRADASRDQ
jgi:ADP-heptose:LPS heptosyltransferase